MIKLYYRVPLKARTQVVRFGRIFGAVFVSAVVAQRSITVSFIVAAVPAALETAFRQWVAPPSHKAQP